MLRADRPLADTGEGRGAGVGAAGGATLDTPTARRPPRVVAAEAFERPGGFPVGAATGTMVMCVLHSSGAVSATEDAGVSTSGAVLAAGAKLTAVSAAVVVQNAAALAFCAAESLTHGSEPELKN